MIQELQEGLRVRNRNTGQYGVFLHQTKLDAYVMWDLDISEWVEGVDTEIPEPVTGKVPLRDIELASGDEAQSMDDFTHTLH